MRSIFTRRDESPASFRISWRGYDRTEVDEFLRQTAADRQRLQEDLAQLEAIMAPSGDERREMERLAAVRREVASCLETSIGALRTATGLLASAAPPSVLLTPPVYAPAPRLVTSPPQPSYVENRRHSPATLNASDGPATLNASLVNKVSRFGALLDLRQKLPSWPVERRKPLLVAVASIAVLMFAGFMYQNQPRASEMPASQPAPELQAAIPAAAVPAPSPEPSAAGTPAPRPQEKTAWY